MKRVRVLLVAATMLVALFTFAFVGTSSTAHADTCTWRVTQSANVYYNVFPSQPQPSRSADAVVSLWRDGCGNVKATIHTLTYADQTAVLLQDAQKKIIGAQGTTSTAVYSGYAGVSISAIGVIERTQGDQALVGVSYTTYDAGS